MPFNMFPYTDLEKLNLDWLLRKMKQLEAKIPTEETVEEIQTEITNLYNMESARGIQQRVRSEGTSNLPLQFADGFTKIIKKSTKTVPSTTIFAPRAIFSWDRKDMTILAAMEFDFDSDNPLYSDSEGYDSYIVKPRDYPVILRGLPTIFSNIMIYNELMLVDDQGGIQYLPARYASENFSQVSDPYHMPASPSVGDSVYIKSTGEWMVYYSTGWKHEYKPCGVLQMAVPLWYLPDGDGVEITEHHTLYMAGRPLRLLSVYGATVFPRITQTDNERACAWIREHRGVFDYSNNSITRRTPPNPYGATDCSGMVHMAYRLGAGKFVPDGTKTMCGYGKIVDFLPAGMPLDMSKLQEGDIVGYIFAETEGRIWACHHVAIAVRGFADDPNDTTLRLWHESTGYGCYAAQGDPIDQPIPSYEQYVHDGKVYGPQPVAGTYRASGKTYTDGTYRMTTDARIVVRWSEDSDALRRPGNIADLLNDFETGGEIDPSGDS